MKQAICISYVVDQNEPSMPRREIVQLSDDVGEMYAKLTEIFLEEFNGVDDIERDEIVCYDGNGGLYGDVVVEYHEVLFLYVTFVG